MGPALLALRCWHVCFPMFSSGGGGKGACGTFGLFLSSPLSGVGQSSLLVSLSGQRSFDVRVPLPEDLPRAEQSAGREQGHERLWDSSARVL